MKPLISYILESKKNPGFNAKYHEYLVALSIQCIIDDKDDWDEKTLKKVFSTKKNSKNNDFMEGAKKFAKYANKHKEEVSQIISSYKKTLKNLDLNDVDKVKVLGNETEDSKDEVKVLGDNSKTDVQITYKSGKKPYNIQVKQEYSQWDTTRQKRSILRFKKFLNDDELSSDTKEEIRELIKMHEHWKATAEYRDQFNAKLHKLYNKDKKLLEKTIKLDLFGEDEDLKPSLLISASGKKGDYSIKCGDMDDAFEAELKSNENKCHIRASIEGRIRHDLEGDFEKLMKYKDLENIDKESKNKDKEPENKDKNSKDNEIESFNGKDKDGNKAEYHLRNKKNSSGKTCQVIPKDTKPYTITADQYYDKKKEAKKQK